MSTNIRFLKFTSICCAITVITTIGIHVLFPEPPADANERLLLFKDPVYIANRWWIIFHCLMVIVSMWGFYLLQKNKSAGFAGLGFLFFAAFAFAEITRQMYVLFYLNGMRELYAATVTSLEKETIKNILAYAGQLASPLFGVFALAFCIGNACYGATLINEKGFSKILGILLLVWSGIGAIQLGNSFWNNPSINLFIEKLSFTFQPIMRLLLAYWIWKKAGDYFAIPGNTKVEQMLR